MLIKNIGKLLGLHPAGTERLCGAEMDTLPFIENAYLRIDEDKIADWGNMSTCPTSTDTVIDAGGGYVLPAFCDSHTHLVFAEPREQEFLLKIKGATYEDIAKAGGGILNSARRLNLMSEDDLFERALVRLKEVQSTGTGAIEIKSGYGLTLDGELKMLRVIRRLREHTGMPIRATFLGAHAFPAEYRENHEAYINLLLNEMLPAIAAEGLADYIDVFCEKGFFSIEETDRILSAGVKYGLKPKIHANQLNVSGGVQIGVKHGAISVDHLECMGMEEVECLAQSRTIPTGLPTAAFFLNLPFPPARDIINANLPLCLATDFNPGSSPSGRMAFVLTLACLRMKMTPTEAINAATINGAAAMEWGTSLGSIEKGKLGNVIITKPIPSVEYIPYAFGSELVAHTVIRGKKV